MGRTWILPCEWRSHFSSSSATSDVPRSTSHSTFTQGYLKYILHTS
jgi:hypothetical protein